MRRLMCLAAFLLAGPAAAQDKPKPNTLTPKEIADGWVLLFDGETAFGWKIDGPVEVKDGKLVIGGQVDTTVTFTTPFGAYEARLELRGPGTVFIESADGGGGGFSVTDSPTVVTVRQSIAPQDTAVVVKTSVGVGNVQDIGATVATAATTKLQLQVGAGKRLSLASAKLRPLGASPLFNGKDLNGWKVFAGEKYKSKFAVTAAGELSVKDGPGDLQTDKPFGDFVLQLECKTNGKALNSGVFFRCLADQYQQGYEAQIQNAYTGDDRTKPADFGTGAIYRRVPARKVVSNDNEWFTMTVVADGKHISTWVNGYQTVDWTDDRPAEENARKGYRAGKGHLSIQGHDPTTDLLFRNIRVAEMK